MDITISAGSWSDIQNLVVLTRKKLHQDLAATENTIKNPHFSNDAYDLNKNTLHIICECNDEPIAIARVLSNGSVDQIAYASNVTEDALTRFFSRVIREAIVHNAEQYIQLHFQNKVPDFIQSLNLNKEETETLNVLTLPCDRELRLSLFDNSVLRLSSEQEFSKHFKFMCLCGLRSLDILSIDLRANRFDHETTNFISRLARYHRNVKVRILVQNTQQLVGSSHPLVNLAQRLTSSISIRKLKEEPDRPEQGYAIFDKSMLLYYNDEREATGFANYQAPAESEHFTEAFERMWQYYSETDPNLVQLHL